MVAAALADPTPTAGVGSPRKGRLRKRPRRIDRGVARDRTSQTRIVAYFYCCWPGLSLLGLVSLWLCCGAAEGLLVGAGLLVGTPGSFCSLIMMNSSRKKPKKGLSRYYG
jgi:hypothetical protein